MTVQFWRCVWLNVSKYPTDYCNILSNGNYIYGTPTFNQYWCEPGLHTFISPNLPIVHIITLRLNTMGRLKRDPCSWQPAIPIKSSILWNFCFRKTKSLIFCLCSRPCNPHSRDRYQTCSDMNKLSVYFFQYRMIYSAWSIKSLILQKLRTATTNPLLRDPHCGYIAHVLHKNRTSAIKLIVSRRYGRLHCTNTKFVIWNIMTESQVNYSILLDPGRLVMDLGKMTWSKLSGEIVPEDAWADSILARWPSQQKQENEEIFPNKNYLLYSPKRIYPNASLHDGGFLWSRRDSV